MTKITLDDILKNEFQDETFKQTFEAEKNKLASALAVMKAREAAGLSQRQLAKEAHLPQSTIARIESGHNTSIETMVKIAQALGKSLEITFVTAK